MKASKFVSAVFLGLVACANAFAAACPPDCDPATVSEPGSLALIGLGIAGAVAAARFMKK